VRGGDAVGRSLAELGRGPGTGARHGRASGWSCLPPWCRDPRRRPLPDPLRGPWWHTEREALRVTAWAACGARAGQQQGQGRAGCDAASLHNRVCSRHGGWPGWRGRGSPPSGLHPALAPSPWPVGSPGRCGADLEEETSPSLFSNLILILFLPPRGIVFESRASSADWVVFICLAEMFSRPEQQPPPKAKGRVQPPGWRRGAAWLEPR